jgi:hypothetical protein
MLHLNIAVLLLGLSSIIAGAAVNRKELGGTSLRHRQNADPTCLASDALQTASEKTGQEDGTDGIKPGQARSQT